MSKKYKGFKGSGMNGKPMAHYKMDRLVKECFVRFLANGCKVPKTKEQFAEDQKRTEGAKA